MTDQLPPAQAGTPVDEAHDDTTTAEQPGADTEDGGAEPPGDPDLSERVPGRSPTTTAT